MELLKFVLLSFFFQSLLLCCNNHPSKKNSEVMGVDSDTVSMNHANQPPGQPNQQVNPAAQRQNDSIRIVVKPFSINKDWGYDIIMNDKLYIHQPNIPSVSGNDGFKTKEDAIKTGEFVAFEIRNHILPPTVTPEQLDSLGVLKKK